MPLMKGVGYGQGYRYVHNDPSAREEMPCLSERFAGREYVGRGILDELTGHIGGSRAQASPLLPAKDDDVRFE